jgi:hypothetical protein
MKSRCRAFGSFGEAAYGESIALDADVAELEPRARRRRPLLLVYHREVDRVIVPVEHESQRLEPVHERLDVGRVHEADPREVGVGAQRAVRAVGDVALPTARVEGVDARSPDDDGDSFD